tara:strand:- start:1763 stop:2878 length:1116 start_codon:yes stop_codon:yes gene_type:complete
MMKHKIITISFCISVLLLACGSEPAKKEQVILKGQIAGLTLPELYLIDLLQPKAGPVDTAVVAADGSFAFDYEPKRKGFYRITIGNSFALVTPLATGETVTVSGDVNQLADLKIEGTVDAVQMRDLNNFLRNNAMQTQALDQEFQPYANSPQRDSMIAVLRARFAGIEQEKVTTLKALIDRNPKSFSNLAVIEQMPDTETEYYIKVDKTLAKEHSTSPFYTNFHTKVVSISRFTVGSEVPEINLPNPDGEPVALSSLKGKVVLIDFWASWCKPCRRENPNLVAAYQKYKDKGFTVYGVSLDRTKGPWVNAIAKDNLTWIHVSDLKFWQSVAAKDYGVSSIPFAVLIDAEGKVIGKNLRGAALQQKLAEVLD